MNKNRYVLAILALVVTVFIFEYYFLAPKSEMLRESIETGYNGLKRDEKFIIASGATEAGMNSAVNDMKDIERRLISEKTSFLAAARLQGDVSAFAKKAGLNLLTIRPLSPVKAGNYSNIALYFEGNGNIKQMSEFLKSIESGKLLIKVDKLNLNITNVQDPKDLKFKIQLSGLARI